VLAQKTDFLAVEVATILDLFEPRDGLLDRLARIFEPPLIEVIERRMNASQRLRDCNPELFQRSTSRRPSDHGNLLSNRA